MLHEVLYLAEVPATFCAVVQFGYHPYSIPCFLTLLPAPPVWVGKEARKKGDATLVTAMADA